MKKLLCLLMLFVLGCPAFAEIQPPQWSEFCSQKYENAEYMEYKKHNPLIYPLAFVAQVGTLNIVPVFWNITIKEKDLVNANNYWVGRKKQFDNEIALCKENQQTDNKVSCYMNIRQIELNKTAQLQNLAISQQNLQMQKLQLIQNANRNYTLDDINNNLNGIRYGY